MDGPGIVKGLSQPLRDPEQYGLDAEEGLGVVVPHRAQRAALQEAFPQLRVLDPETGSVRRSAVDTVERFQGGERTAILVSATESDREYLLACSQFLLDPRRLTVAMLACALQGAVRMGSTPAVGQWRNW